MSNELQEYLIDSSHIDNLLIVHCTKNCGNSLQAYTKQDLLHHLIAQDWKMHCGQLLCDECIKDINFDSVTAEAAIRKYMIPETYTFKCQSCNYQSRNGKIPLLVDFFRIEKWYVEDGEITCFTCKIRKDAEKEKLIGV